MVKYSDRHIDLMKEFLNKIHPSGIIQNVPLTSQARKLLILMDVDQLLILDEFFTISQLSERRIEERLKYFGFHSKVNIFEQKSILSDLMKRRLIKIINLNNKLIDYDIPEEVDTNYVYLLLKNLNDYKRKYLEYTGETHIEKKTEFPSRDHKRRPMFMELHNERTFMDQLSEKVLPTSTEDVEPIDIFKKTKHPRSFYSDEMENQTSGYTIHDLVDDNTVILRKKKTLYLDPSVPIDYTGEEKLEYKSVREDIRQAGKDTFDPEIYKEFHPRDFVNETVFKNNNITIPESNLTFEELRKKMKGSKLFLDSYLIAELKRLILSQDETISSSDAGLLAIEMKKFLTPAQVEYFYNRYIKSASYKPVEHQVNKDFHRRRFLGNKRRDFKDDD